MGATARAGAGFLAAESLYAGTGQRLEIAYARQNRALVAFASGDLPAALRHLDDAAARYAELGVTVPDAALDRCTVLLAAALPADALASALQADQAGDRRRRLSRCRAAPRASPAGGRHPAAGRCAPRRAAAICWLRGDDRPVRRDRAAGPAGPAGFGPAARARGAR